MDHEDDLDDPNYGADRYEDAIGWQPTDPYKKQRGKVREQMHRCFNYESMLQTLPANEWRFRRQEKAAPPRPLYHDLWFEGELAVLIGPRGSAKSILSVQLGQQIARGRRLDTEMAGHRDAETSVASSLIPHPSPLIPQSVLYIDCQRSRAQWEERYSSPLFPGDTRQVHHRFPRNFQRAALDWDGTVPDEFNGDLGKFLQYSIMQEIDRSGAKVVILDDLTAFCGGSTTSLGLTKALRMLKLLSVTHTLSILALHTVSTPRVGRPRVNSPLRTPHSSLPSSVSSLPASLRIYDAADTVFTIAHSTFAPDIRYVKHLTGPRPITHDASNLLTYRLERPTGAQASLPASSATENTESTEPLPAPISSLPSPVPPSPFLALTDLGPSQESDHLRDYAAEAMAAERAHQAQLKKLRRRGGREILVDGVLDGSYGKYLKGE